MKLFLVAGFLSLFLFQCSTESGPEALIEVSVVPSQPLAINAPVTINQGSDEEIVYPENVVSFSLRIKNDSESEYHLAVVALKVTFKNIASGEILTNSFDAGTFGLDFVASVAPGADEVIDNGSQIIKFYTGGLPSDDSNIYRYRAELQLIGWFTKVSKCGGDSICDTDELFAEQSKRLIKTVTFSTL